MTRPDTLSREKILASARVLFWRHGIRRISIEEICAHAGISRMTFYKHFRNKISVAKAVLDLVAAEGRQKYDRILAEEMPFADRVRKMIALKIEQTNDLDSEFFVDIHRSADPEFHAYVAEMFRKGIDETMRYFIEAQKRGDVRKEIKAEFFPYIMNHMIAMAKDEALNRMYDSPQAMIMELTNFYFYGIMPCERALEQKRHVMP